MWGAAIYNPCRRYVIALSGTAYRMRKVLLNTGCGTRMLDLLQIKYIVI